MTRTDLKTPPANPHKHDHGLTQVDAALATLTARMTAAEKDAAVTKALLLAAIEGGTFHPPPPEPPPEPPAGPVVYISPTGNNSTGTGSIGNPWQALQKFYDSRPAPGTTCYVRGGTYPRGTYTSIMDPSISGTADAPITVMAYPGETPVFPGGVGNNFIHFDRGCAYHVMDGLHITGYAPTGGAILWVGHTNDAGAAGATLTHHITFRHLLVTKGSGGNIQSHGLYNSWMSDHVTIEDSTLIGASEFGSNANAAIHAYHPPNTTNLVVRRCIIDSWEDGFLLWDGDPVPSPRRLTASILHNTIKNCSTMADLRWHGAITFRDNVGQLKSGGARVYDPNDSASTTSDHNYLSETLTGYALQGGSSAINGASDGSNAGAVQ